MLVTEIRGVSTQILQIPSVARNSRHAPCLIDAWLFQVYVLGQETIFNMTASPFAHTSLVKLDTMAPLPLALFNPGSSQAVWRRIPIPSAFDNSVKWHYGDPNQLGHSGIFDWSTVKSKRADTSRIQKRDDETTLDAESGHAGNGGHSGDSLDTDRLTYLDRALEGLEIADENPEGLGWDIEEPLSPIPEEEPLSPIPEEVKPLSPIAEEEKPLSPIAEED
jgi:hypothetical protein